MFSVFTSILGKTEIGVQKTENKKQKTGSVTKHGLSRLIFYFYFSDQKKKRVSKQFSTLQNFKLHRYNAGMKNAAYKYSSSCLFFPENYIIRYKSAE